MTHISKEAQQWPHGRWAERDRIGSRDNWSTGATGQPDMTGSKLKRGDGHRKDEQGPGRQDWRSSGTVMTRDKEAQSNLAGSEQHSRLHA